MKEIDGYQNVVDGENYGGRGDDNILILGVKKRRVRCDKVTDMEDIDRGV